MNSNITREIVDSGICILTFDRPDSSANILDEQTLDELNDHLEFLEQEKSLKGLVIHSAKPKIFIAGVDLNAFAHELTDDAVLKLIELGQNTFSRLSQLPLTTVAAIHGACLGGGLELALACDYRVASSDKATKIGLPEVQLGILPAWGGSTRLPRLLGFTKALNVILSGKIYAAKHALKLGIVDTVAYPEYIIKIASVKAMVSKRTNYPFFFVNTLPVAALIAGKVRKDIIKKTKGNYPAPLKALKVIKQSMRGTVEKSLKREKQALLELVKTEASRNLVNIFFLQERSKKLKIDVPGKDASKESLRKTTTTAVVGAGVMGSGIAQWVSARNIQVLLKDISKEQLAHGMKHAQRLYKEGIKRKVFTAVEAQKGMDRIRPVSVDVPLLNTDIVIEAVVEKMDLKKKIFQQLEEQASPSTILATNTSALSISEIADELKRPENVIGIHFFNPVHRMKLVEIIKGVKTSNETLGKTLGFVKSIGKLPVIVSDSPGFLVNRILMPYLLEAVRLFQEGYSIGLIDEAMLQFGMPMGPLRLIDEVGLDVAQHVALDLNKRLNSPIQLTDILEQMLQLGWTGKKTGRGFYLYNKGSHANDENPHLAKLQKASTPSRVDREALQDRMVLLMINEAARCLEENVVEAPEDVDFGMIMGTGWAPSRGGPLRYADTITLPLVVKKMEHLQGTVSDHYQPCDLLKDRVNKDQSFYTNKTTMISDKITEKKQLSPSIRRAS